MLKEIFVNTNQIKAITSKIGNTNYQPKTTDSNYYNTYQNYYNPTDPNDFNLNFKDFTFKSENINLSTEKSTDGYTKNKINNSYVVDELNNSKKLKTSSIKLQKKVGEIANNIKIEPYKQYQVAPANSDKNSKYYEINNDLTFNYMNSIYENSKKLQKKLEFDRYDNLVKKNNYSLEDYSNDSMKSKKSHAYSNIANANVKNTNNISSILKSSNRANSSSKMRNYQTSLEKEIIKQQNYKNNDKLNQIYKVMHKEKKLSFNSLSSHKSKKSNKSKKSDSVLFSFKPQTSEDIASKYFEGHSNKYYKVNKKSSQKGLNNISRYCNYLLKSHFHKNLKNNKNLEKYFHKYKFSGDLTNYFSNNKTSTSSNQENNQRKDSFLHLRNLSSSNLSQLTKNTRKSKITSLGADVSNLDIIPKHHNEQDRQVLNDINMIGNYKFTNQQEIDQGNSLKFQLEEKILFLSNEVNLLKNKKNLIDQNIKSDILEIQKMESKSKAFESKSNLSQNEAQLVMNQIDEINLNLQNLAFENKKLHDEMVFRQNELKSIENLTNTTKSEIEKAKNEKKRLFYLLTDIGKKRKLISVQLDKRVIFY